jgi:hypothetical protein
MSKRNLESELVEKFYDPEIFQKTYKDLVLRGSLDLASSDIGLVADEIIVDIFDAYIYEIMEEVGEQTFSFVDFKSAIEGVIKEDFDKTAIK